MTMNEKVKQQLDLTKPNEPNGASTTIAKKPNTLGDYLNSDMVKAQFKQVLPDHMKPDKFMRILISAVNRTPKLRECTPSSVLSAMLQSAALGLEPNTPLGDAYLIPFYNHKTKVTECQFMLGYQGIITLGRNSGAFSALFSEAVYEGDVFEYEYGSNHHLKHIPSISGRGERPKLYYAYAKLKDGGESFKVMSREDIERHAMKFSKSQSNGTMYGPWVDNFDAMAMKTMIKQLFKLMPLSPEVRNKIATDETIKSNPESEPLSVFDDSITTPTNKDEATESIVAKEGDSQ